MKSFHINNKIVQVYDSIDELPIVNFQKYNKYLLIDAGVGSDIDDVDAHITRLARYIVSNDSKKALQELQNMRQNIHMINSKISPKYLAFAALIHSVDEKKVNDLSDDGLKELLADLNEVKHSVLVDLLIRLKKKVETELETYFPGDFTSPKEKEFYDTLKNRTLLVLQSVATGADNSERINEIDAKMLSSYKPKTFMGSESVEVKYDKQFESTCLLISQKTNMDARKMTVFQFYNALENIKSQVEAEMKSLKSIKR